MSRHAFVHPDWVPLHPLTDDFRYIPRPAYAGLVNAQLRLVAWVYRPWCPNRTPSSSIAFELRWHQSRHRRSGWPGSAPAFPPARWHIPLVQLVEATALQSVLGSPVATSSVEAALARSPTHLVNMLEQFSNLGQLFGVNARPGGSS